MDGIQGAVLSVKLRHLENGNLLRRAHAAEYNRAFSSTEEVFRPVEAAYAKHGQGFADGGGGKDRSRRGKTRLCAAFCRPRQRLGHSEQDALLRAEAFERRRIAGLPVRLLVFIGGL